MIYVVGDGRHNVKVGFTRSKAHLKARLAVLQTAHAHPLSIICAVPGWPVHERRLHELLAAHRLIGEWFDGSAELVENTIHLLKGYGVGFVLRHDAAQLTAFCPLGEGCPNWGALHTQFNPRQLQGFEALVAAQRRARPPAIDRAL